MSCRGAGWPRTRTGTADYATHCSACSRVSPHTAPLAGPLPVQDFIPTLHVEPEVREGNGDGTVFPSNEVPGSVICHFLPLFSVLPAPLTLLIPGRVGGSQDQELREGRASLGRARGRRGVLHGLHVQFGQVEGPVHSGCLQSGHSLTLNGDVQPEKTKKHLKPFLLSGTFPAALVLNGPLPGPRETSSFYLPSPLKASGRPQAPRRRWPTPPSEECCLLPPLKTTQVLSGGQSRTGPTPHCFPKLTNAAGSKVSQSAIYF